MIYIGFSYYYIGFLVFALYLIFFIRLFKIKLDIAEASFIIAIIILTIFKTYNIGFYNLLFATRFHFGFILFYLYFRSGKKMNVDKLLFYLALLTIIEAILIHTVISPEALPHYAKVFRDTADANGWTPHRSYIFGFYQRVFSFGGSPSVTSIILVALLTLRKDKENRALFLITLFAIILCVSGSGFFALFIYLAFNKRKIFFLICGILGFTVIAYGFVSFGYNYVKFSPKYFMYLLTYKIEYILSYFHEASVSELLFGVLLGNEIFVGGDFAIFNFIKMQGFLGLGLLFLFSFYKMNRYNYQAIIIMLIGSFHYACFSFFPGQIIFAYTLIYNDCIELDEQIHNSSFASKKLCEVC